MGVPKPLARDRIEAAKNLVMTDLAPLSAEIISAPNIARRVKARRRLRGRKWRADLQA